MELVRIECYHVRRSIDQTDIAAFAFLCDGSAIAQKTTFVLFNDARPYDFGVYYLGY